MSPDTPTRERLLNSSKFIYLAKPNVHGLITHKHRGTTAGNVAVLRDDEDEDALFQGVFTIDTRKFHLDPNGTMGFNEADAAKTKLSCLLSAVPKTQAFAEFRFAAEDYPAMINNLKAVMKSVPMPADFKIKPCFDDNRVGNEGTLIRLNHSLFERIGEDSPTPKYTFDEWCPLLEDKNKPSFERLGYQAKHQIVPLPVYKHTGKKWVSMGPHEYRSLQEAVVHVIFTVVHWTISSKKEVVFNLVPCAIYLLRRKYTTEPPSAQISNRKRALILDSSDSEKESAAVPSKVQKNTAESTTASGMVPDSTAVASDPKKTAESATPASVVPDSATAVVSAVQENITPATALSNIVPDSGVGASKVIERPAQSIAQANTNPDVTAIETPSGTRASSIDPDAASEDEYVDIDNEKDVPANDK